MLCSKLNHPMKVLKSMHYFCKIFDLNIVYHIHRLFHFVNYINSDYIHDLYFIPN
jgi:hypothetical protein